MDIKTGSVFIKESTSILHNGTRLEPCNHIDVISIPSDIKAYISFVQSPKDEKKYPLKNNSQIVLTNNSSSEIYLFTEGTSNEDIELNLSTIGNNETNVIISQSADKVSLNTDISNALKLSAFIPKNDFQVTISSGGNYELLKNDLIAIDFTCTEELGLSLNNSNIKRLMMEQIIILDELEKIVFHNDNATDSILTIWSM